MLRLMIVCALMTVFLIPTGWTEVKDPPPKELIDKAPKGAAKETPKVVPKEAPTTETVIKLKVDAMAPPKPALKYQLLPEFKEMQPGNPIHAYMKCFAEQNNYFHAKESNERLEKWLTAPLEELTDEVLPYTRGGPMKRMDEAARLDNPNWGILLELRRDGMWTTLPDVQGLRQLGSWNKVRMRFEVKEKRFDDVIRSAKSMFALGRHMEENLTMIGDLVGLAIINSAIGPLEEMLNQPGAPNLFWAWSTLPSPMISLHRGLQTDRASVLTDFAPLLEGKRIWGDAEIEEAKEKLSIMGGLFEAKLPLKKKIEAWMLERLTDEPWLKSTRKELIDSGYPEASVKKYPAEQVVLFHMIQRYEIIRDDRLKWIQFPYWQIQDQAASLEAEAKENGNIDELLTGFFAPYLGKVRRSQVRTEQRFNMLRIVEGLRLYAAEHEGKLPEKLSDIKIPMPIDPFSGKDFKYKLEGGTAILRGTAPKGEEKNAAFNIRYEVTIRK